MTPQRLIRFASVQETVGLSRSTIYVRIAEGMSPPAIPIGPRSVAWRESEISALNAARIRGASDDEIRVLVIELVAARQSVVSRTEEGSK
jgi:prophage regulatory protein